MLRQADLKVEVITTDELARHRQADAVMLRIPDRDPVDTCWTLHRQGYRSVIALSTTASSRECIRLLNAGADYYLDAWLPAAEVVARVRVVLRFSGWLDRRHEPAPGAALPGRRIA